jgi:hypothetical protein
MRPRFSPSEPAPLNVLASRLREAREAVDELRLHQQLFDR